MHFITEQEIQLQHRKTPLTSFQLGNEDRLTPGAHQFLVDHQIKLIKAGTTSTVSESEVKVDLAGLLRGFRLLAIELQEAAVKAYEIDLAAAGRIIKLAEWPLAIHDGESLDGSGEAADEVSIPQLAAAAILTPQGKILIKLKRSQVFAEGLKSDVNETQQQQLDQLILKIEEEIQRLLPEGVVSEE